MRARDIPNLISIARILLVGPIVVCLLQRRFDWALALFAIAGVSDALDGYLAKRYDWTTRLGGMLDPIADKLLLVSTYFCLGWLGAADWWLVGLVLLRDLVIVSGAVVYHLRVAHFEARPTPVSKLNTTLPILFALLVVFDLAGWSVPGGLLQAFAWAVVLTTVWSGIAYVRAWGARARQHWSGDRR